MDSCLHRDDSGAFQEPRGKQKGGPQSPPSSCLAQSALLDLRRLVEVQAGEAARIAGSAEAGDQ